jgi:hypothetical protein
MIFVQSLMFSDICPVCGNYEELYDVIKSVKTHQEILRTACVDCLKNDNLKESR